jgi:hypothetical protein
MSRLYLLCAICGRQQADGLLSRAAWVHVVRADRSNVSACPTCKETHSDLEQRLHSLEASPPRYGGVYRTA